MVILLKVTFSDGSFDKLTSKSKNMQLDYFRLSG